jgi:type III secretory pathway component EscV
MAKITKTIVDKDLRDRVFNDLGMDGIPVIEQEFQYHKINDRQYGVLMIDLNGHQRYVRVSAIVAEERDDMTAEELMQSEIEAYNQKQATKAEKAKAKEKKIAKDKARREAEAKAKEEQTNG